jgi:hypothetical protein
MFDVHFKFIFLKTPQIRHRFTSHNKKIVFPVIRHEIYHASLMDNTYEFFGKSFSGSVSVDDFNYALREEYVSIVTDD